MRDRYYAAAAGNRSAAYYQKRFNYFRSHGSGVSWNWAACFLGLPWLVYRKMWIWALLYFIPLLIAAAFATLVPSSLIKGAPAYVIYLLLAGVLFPMYANALYYGQLRNKIQRILGLVDDVDERIRQIADECGTNVVPALVVFVALLVPLLMVVEDAVSGGVASYQDRLFKEKIEKRLLLGERYKKGVEEYFFSNQEWPGSTADLKGSIPNVSADTKKIEIKGDGELILHFTDIAGDRGGTISLLPMVREDEKIRWKCAGTGVALRYLPVRCRD